MLSITVKTMDSQSRQFDIEENITVKDFKNHIQSSVNVPANQQRLIYQGRVLADDFKLSKDHDGKVFHLVQRIPVGVTSGGASSTSSTSTTSSSQTNQQTNTNTYNPAQLSQMIFQQAMGGLMNATNLTAPNASNRNLPGEQMFNIHIEMNTTQAPGSVTRATTNTTAVPGRPRNQRAGHSAPRQELQALDRIFTHLDTVLGELERLNYEVPSAEQQSTSAPKSSAGEESEAGQGEVFANDFDQPEVTDEPMDASSDATSSDASESPASSTTSGPAQPEPASASSAGRSTCVNHPSLGELGTHFQRMLDMQRRMEPYLNRLVEFLNTDPAFSSTQSPEYHSTARMLTLTLQTQQMMADIQRRLSRVVIPLGRTPPRSMLLRGPPGVMHPPRGAVRAVNLVQGGAAIPGMQSTPASAPRQQPAPRFSAHIRPPMPFAGVHVHPPLIPPMPPGMQVRVMRTPAPSNAPTGSFGNVPTATNTGSARANSQSSGGTTGASINPATTAAAVGAGMNQQTGTRVDVAPPVYTVQINASIQPHVVISVMPNATVSSTSTTTSASTRNFNQQPNQASTGLPGAPTSVPGNTSFSGNVPNIPGVPQDVLSSLFQSIARPGEQGGPAPTAQGFLVVGPPGGENQIVQDVSNIIGHTVMNVMQSTLSGANSSEPTTGSTTTVSSTQTRRADSSAYTQTTSTTASQSSSSQTSIATNNNSSQTPSAKADTSSVSGTTATTTSTTSAPLASTKNLSPTASIASTMAASTSSAPTAATAAPSSSASIPSLATSSESSKSASSVSVSTFADERNGKEPKKGKPADKKSDKAAPKEDQSRSKSPPRPTRPRRVPRAENFSDRTPEQQVEDLTEIIVSHGGGENAGAALRELLNLQTRMSGGPDVARVLGQDRRSQPRVAPRSTRSAAENRMPGQSHSREVEVLARALAPGHKSHIDKDIPAKEFIRLLGYDVPDLTSDKNSLVAKIMDTIAAELTCTEIVGIVKDDPEPLNRIRPILKKLYSAEFFGGRDPTCVEDIEAFPTSLREAINDYVNVFFETAKGKPDYDVVESNLSFFRHAFKKALGILYLSGNKSFANDMSQHIRFVIAAWVALNDFILIGGKTQLTPLLKNYKYFQPNDAAVIRLIEAFYVEGVKAPLENFMDYLLSFATITPEQRNKFVRKLPSAQQDAMVVDVPSTSTGADKKGEHKNSVQSDGDDSTSAAAATTSDTDEDWKKVVPAEWVDTIASDVEKQKNLTPQLPFSDAYKAGMPANKRRKVAS
ncbi:unnamed protein product [Clavelina lepadiformis]|uniref:Large proline-rich protein BAG6 n=1 Tax=Clavelina lepadiformis TaxID=159417 RepID=A0ABP0F1N6_CLALP